MGFVTLTVTLTVRYVTLTVGNVFSALKHAHVQVYTSHQPSNAWCVCRLRRRCPPRAAWCSPWPSGPPTLVAAMQSSSGAPCSFWGAGEHKTAMQEPNNPLMKRHRIPAHLQDILTKASLFGHSCNSQRYRTYSQRYSQRCSQRCSQRENSLGNGCFWYVKRNASYSL